MISSFTLVCSTVAALLWAKLIQTYTFSGLSHQTASRQPPLSSHQRRGRKPARRMSHGAEQFWSWYEFLNVNPAGKNELRIDAFLFLFLLRLLSQSFLSNTLSFVFSSPLSAASRLPKLQPAARVRHFLNKHKEMTTDRLRASVIYMTDYSVISHLFAWISSASSPS